MFNFLNCFFQKQQDAISKRITWGHWFSLFNIIIALGIASRYAFNADWPNTLIGKLYFFISLFGHFSFVVFAIYVLILFPLSFIVKNQITFRIVSIIIATIGMSILLIDTEIFKTLYLHLSPLVWKIFVTPKDLSNFNYWYFIIPILTILITEIFCSYWIWNKLRRFKRQKWGKSIAFFFISCFVATHLFYAIADIMLYRPITAQKFNYPLSYPMTAKSFFEKHGLAQKDILDQKIKQNGRPDAFYLDYPKTTLQIDKTIEKNNIIIINIKNLNLSQINIEKMPALSNIRANSINFTKHYSAGDSSIANIVGLFYGLSGQYVDSILNEKKSSPLIDVLQQHQYKLGLFSTNGFKEPIYKQALFRKLKLYSVKSNNIAITKWENWLNTVSNQPFFSYLDLNASKILSLDKQLATLWQSLESKDLLSKTTVVITANFIKNNNSSHFDNSHLKLPMMLYTQNKAQIYDQVSSHLDILPTLLNEYLGVENSISDYAQGINLMQKNDREWVLAANRLWRVAIMPEGEQYQIKPKNGYFKYVNNKNEKQNNVDIPLNLFLQLIHDSNHFMEK